MKFKKHIHLHKFDRTTEQGEKQWRDFRTQAGFGASEIGVLMGLDPDQFEGMGKPYRSVGQLLMQKAGLLPPDQTNNHMMAGVINEPLVAQLFGLYEGSFHSIYRNTIKGHTPNKSVDLGAICVNDKYPGLFATPDRIITKYYMRGRERGCLECKSMQGYTVRKYIAGYPPTYMFQVYAQMMVLEVSYGLLAIQVDNRDFVVHEFERDATVEATIMNVVNRANDYLQKIIEATHDIEDKEEAVNIAFSLCPDEPSSEVYDTFLEEVYRYGRPKETVEYDLGTPAEQAYLNYLEAKKSLSEAGKIQDDARHEILKHMATDGVAEAMYINNKLVATYKEDKKGVRRLIVRDAELID